METVLSNATSFLNAAIQLMPRIRGRLQLGYGIIVALVGMTLLATPDTPQIALIFVFATVPLIISMQLIARLTPVLQFVIVLVITLMTLAFLGTGIGFTAMDRSPTFTAEYRDKVHNTEFALAERYWLGKPAYDHADTYPSYRKVMLGYYNADKGAGDSDLSTVVTYYSDLLECRRQWRCTVSKEMDDEMVGFWYTFRPIIEDQRLGYYGQSYGAAIQQLAEREQPPYYASKVRLDAATNQTELVNDQPLRAG